MSVLSHLESIAQRSLLTETEKLKIATSLANLESKIKRYFGYHVSESFKFGSYPRETILPRKMDSLSDVDYMIVFSDETRSPQTYLKKLRAFATSQYFSSEIWQSSPTIVLELHHIRFDLVPAIAPGVTYQIPTRRSSYDRWEETYPLLFQKELQEANSRHNYKIKPMLRILKYWNGLAGYPYESFYLEQWATRLQFIYCTNLRDYVFAAFEQLPIEWNDPQWKKDKVERAKRIIFEVRRLESENSPYLAESKLLGLIP